MLSTATKLTMLQERYKSETEKIFIASLKDALEIISGKLSTSEDLTQLKRLNAIKRLVEQEIGKLYQSLKLPIQQDMQGFAEISHQTIFDALNKETGLGYAFAALPKDTMKEIISMNEIRLVGDKAYTLKEMFNGASNAQINRYKQIISGGLASNDGYRSITKRLKDANAKATTDVFAIVHTAISSARDKADAKAFKQFDDVITHWESVSVLDSRTSLLCAGLDGRKYYKKKGYPTYDSIPNRPPRHFRCLLGDTLISTRYPISYISRRAYKGSIYTIVTASGNTIKCTPNHPILTDRGFVSAQSINKGYKIATELRSKGLRFINSQNNKGEAIIEDLFSSIGEAFGVSSEVMPLTSEDFHGDVTDNKVDVVFINRELFLKNEARISKVTSDNSFIFTNPFTFGFSDIAKSFMFLRNTFGGFMTRFNLFGSCLSIHKRPFDSLLFGLRSYVNTLPNKLRPKSAYAYIKPFRYTSEPNTPTIKSDTALQTDSSIVPFGKIKGNSSALFDNPNNDALIEAKLSTDILNGSLGDEVFLDDVVDVIISENVLTHVYNLENDLGYYTANNLITHNCRSSIVARTSFHTETTRAENETYTKEVSARDKDGKVVRYKSGIHEGKIKKKTVTIGGDKGQIDSKIKFKDWFASQSGEFQENYLGKARYDLYKDERLKIKDFVDVKSGHRFTLDEIRGMI